jgi:DNA-binding transcriptional LysR family regulator
MLPFSRFNRYFQEVASQGSLRRAAEILHVSASAIDRQIIRAEAALDIKLFERLPTGLKLTAAGELMLGDVRRWRKEYARTVERLDELRGLRRGHVGIALVDALSEGVIPQTITQIGKKFPHLTFDLEVLDNRDVGNQVAAAAVDVGLLFEPVENFALDKRIAIDFPVGVALPVDHPLRSEDRLTLSQILPFPQILPGDPLIVHERVVAIYARHRVNTRQFVTCNDVKMMRSLVRSGAGVGILSLIDVASDVDEGRLAFVPLSGRGIRPLTLALCVAPQRQLSRAAQLAIDRLVIALKALRDRLGR